MERIFDGFLVVLCILGTLSIINFFVKQIHIPDILMAIFLVLFSLVFLLRVFTMKKNQD